MMVNQEETIKSLQNEVLRLKLTCHHYERQLSATGRPPGRDLDETKRDLIADLMDANDELKNQLNAKIVNESKERPATADFTCQTPLDMRGIDRLLEDSITLERQTKLHSELSEQFQQMKQSLSYHQTISQQAQQQLQKQQQLQQQQLQKQQEHTRQQLAHEPSGQHPNQPHLYQSLSWQAKPLQRQPSSRGEYQTIPDRGVTPGDRDTLGKPRQAKPLHWQATADGDYQTISDKGMTQEEKETLQKLIKLDSILSTARDNLRASAYNKRGH